MLYKTIRDYQAQDDRVTATDQYINVRDMQVFWSNFDSLLARARRPSCITHHSFAASIGGWVPSLNTRDGGDQRLGPWTVFMPPATNEVTLRAYGKLVGATTTTAVRVYPVLSRPGEHAWMDPETVLTVNSASLQWWEIDIPVPQTGSAASRSKAQLSLYIQSELDSISAEASGTCVDSTYRTVTVSSDIGSGHAVDSDNGESGLRMVTFADTVTVDASTYYRYQVHPPWTRKPSQGDTIRSWNVQYFDLQDMTVQAKRASTFDPSIPVQNQ